MNPLLNLEGTYSAYKASIMICLESQHRKKLGNMVAASFFPQAGRIHAHSQKRISVLLHLFVKAKAIFKTG